MVCEPVGVGCVVQGGEALNDASEVMDIRQAATYLGVSVDTMYRYASTGNVPSFRMGNRWRFKRELVDAWMVEQSFNNVETGGAK